MLAGLKARHEEIPGGHLGLNNVDRIVRLYYGKEYGLTAESGNRQPGDAASAHDEEETAC
ncbi:MAG: hypothetical protein V8T45_01670 [Oscillospiraceae bacterium]